VACFRAIRPRKCHNLAPVLALSAVSALSALTGCGLSVQSADLFLLTRQGPGGQLTLRVSDGGTIRCNGGKSRAMSDAQLIQARTLADDLDGDARDHLTLQPGPRSVYRFRIQLQNGTVTFADTNAVHHRVLAEAELFAVQAAQQLCGRAS
jgi:hypothetical protein